MLEITTTPGAGAADASTAAAAADPLATLAQALATAPDASASQAALAAAADGKASANVLLAVAAVYRDAMLKAGDELDALTRQLQQVNGDQAGLAALLAALRAARPAGDADATAPLTADVLDRLKSYGVTLPELPAASANGVYLVSQQNFDTLLANGQDQANTMGTKQSQLLLKAQEAKDIYQNRCDTSSAMVKANGDLLSMLVRGLA